jgi:hypothetical protein
MDLERVKQSLERTCENVLYLSVGQFDLRLELAGARLEVKVFALCGEGDALAECAASSDEVCGECPADCGRGGVAARGKASEEVTNG